MAIFFFTRLKKRETSSLISGKASCFRGFFCIKLYKKRTPLNRCNITLFKRIGAIRSKDNSPLLITGDNIDRV